MSDSPEVVSFSHLIQAILTRLLGSRARKETLSSRSLTPTINGRLFHRLEDETVETVSTRQNASKIPDEEQIESFKFLDLPSELRLQVYEMFLVYSGDIKIYRRGQDSDRLSAIRCPDVGRRFPWGCTLPGRCTFPWGCGYFVGATFVGAKSRKFASIRYPNNFALLWTCRLIHDEAAHVLYSMNTFSFDSDRGFLNFVFFSQRLTNQHSLRNLSFLPMDVFDSQRNSKYALSEWAHAALKTINQLPNVRMTAFTARTNLPLDSLTMITMICRALRGTQCSLILQKPICEPCRDLWRGHHLQSLPKIHYSVLATLVDFGWKVMNDYEVIDTPGSIPQRCH